MTGLRDGLKGGRDDCMTSTLSNANTSGGSRIEIQANIRLISGQYLATILKPTILKPTTIRPTTPLNPSAADMDNDVA